MVNRELTTADDVSLSEIFRDVLTDVELFNEADRPFRQLLATDVSERVFRMHTGDMTWEELAEGEHARTGRLEETQMGFAVRKFGRSLGFSQEFIEDNPADLVRRQVRKLLEGAAEKENEVVFDTLKNGIADGSGEWFTPEDYGAYSFDATHDHVFADTSDLFGDASAHTATSHIRELNKDLRHHGMRPTLALVGFDLASEFVDELAYDAQYLIPEAEGLVSTALPDATLRIDGVTIFQTAHIDNNDVYVIAGDEDPIYFHTARPVQITEGANGGPVGDPGALIGSYGSARYGAVMANPYAAVKVTADNIGSA